MPDSVYFPLMQARLMLEGAVSLFENEGSDIIAKLQEDEYGKLKTALDGIGEALYFARDKVSRVLLHDLSEEVDFFQSHHSK